MNETEIIKLVSAMIASSQTWVFVILSAVLAVQSLIFGALLLLPTRLRRDFVSREVIELRLAENDAFHTRLAESLGELKREIAGATTAINGHASTETQLLTEILKAIQENRKVGD